MGRLWLVFGILFCMSEMALAVGNTEICGDIFSRHTLLFVFKKDVKEDNESSRSKAVSQTHTICNLGVCLCACYSN